jgi:hypothetical protein
MPGYAAGDADDDVGKVVDHGVCDGRASIVLVSTCQRCERGRGKASLRGSC